MPRIRGGVGRQPVARDGSAGPYGESSALQSHSCADVFRGGSLEGEDAPCVIKQRCAVGGEPYSFGAGRAPLQQRQFELPLQLAHCLGHGGLADEQRVRGPGKALLLGNGAEDAQ